MRRGELICGILLLIFAGNYLVMAAEFNIGLERGVPGPGMLPFILGLLLILLSAIYVIRTWRRKQGEERFWTGDVGSLAVCAALYLGYILVLDTFGFILATLLFGLITLKFLFKTNWLKSLAASVILTLVFQVGFYNLLDVPLPKGLTWKIFSAFGIVTGG